MKIFSFLKTACVVLAEIMLATLSRDGWREPLNSLTFYFPGLGHGPALENKKVNARLNFVRSHIRFGT